MPSLHLINGEQALLECLSVASKEDSLLLLGAAVLAETDGQRPLLGLADDVPGDFSCPDSIELISYQDFVELTVSHQPIITWR